MKKWLLLFFGLFLPFIGNGWEFCCPKDWCFDLSGGAEALYWKPYNDDFVYGDYISFSTSEQRILTLEPASDWGFRIFARVADKCVCNFLDVEWVRITNSFSETNGPREGFALRQFSFGSSSTISAVSLKARQDTRYQKFSTRLAHRFCGNECRYLFGFLGGRWIHINVNQSCKGMGLNAYRVKQKTHFDGGGIEAGVGGYANLWCGLGTSFRLGGIGVVGDRSFSVAGSNTGNFVNSTADRVTTRTLGAVEVRADVNYTYCCNCFWIRGSVGYEQDYYFNSLLFTGAQLVPSAQFTSDFGIGGLVFGVTVGY